MQLGFKIGRNLEKIGITTSKLVKKNLKLFSKIGNGPSTTQTSTTTSTTTNIVNTH